METFDPIELLESVYTSKATLQDWLDELTSAALPALGRGFGVLAHSAQFGPGGIFETQSLVASGEDPGAAVKAAQALVPILDSQPPELRFEIMRTLGYQSASEMAHQMAGVEDFTADPLYQAYAHPAGIYDMVGLVIPDPTGVSLSLAAPSKKVVTVSQSERQLWEHLAVHIAAGLRLQISGDVDLDFDTADAVLSPDGELLHGQEEAAEEMAREFLRMGAQAISRARGGLRRRDPEEALKLWRGLVDGRWSLVDRFDSDGKRFYIARKNAPTTEAPQALSERERQIAQLVAMGYSNKLISYALGLSASAVATYVQRARTKLGFASRNELIRFVRSLELPFPAPVS